MSETNYVLATFLFIVYFRHLVVKKYRQIKSLRTPTYTMYIKQKSPNPELIFWGRDFNRRTNKDETDIDMKAFSPTDFQKLTRNHIKRTTVYWGQKLSSSLNCNFQKVCICNTIILEKWVTPRNTLKYRVGSTGFLLIATDHLHVGKLNMPAKCSLESKL